MEELLELPCECVAAGQCPRFGRKVNWREHQVCRGVNVHPDARLACLRSWLTPAGKAAAEHCNRLAEIEEEKRRPKDVPAEGPGTELKAIFQNELGVPATGCEGCAATLHWMNKLGPAGCRENIAEIERQILENRRKAGIKRAAQIKAAVKAGLKGYTSLRSIIEEAIRRAEAKEKSKMDFAGMPTSPKPMTAEQAAKLTEAMANAPPPAEAPALTWAYGITTVLSRKDDLLPRTLASLKAGGFGEPRLFLDGASHGEAALIEQHFGLPVTARNPAVKAYGNWILTLLEIWLRNPWADRYAIFQDDLVCCRNLRAYLERAPWPDPKGYLNLITQMNNERMVHQSGQAGWLKAATGDDEVPGDPTRKLQGGKGALGLVFSHKGVVELLSSRYLAARPIDKNLGTYRLDGGIVTAMNLVGWTEWVHNPSLVEHTGAVTTIDRTRFRKDGSRTGSPAGIPVNYLPTMTFRGEEFDALELLKT